MAKLKQRGIIKLLKTRRRITPPEILPVSLLVIQDKHVLDGRMIKIKCVIPRGNVPSKGPKTKKIFVGGIPTSIIEDEFKDYFSKFGKIVEHQIMQDRGSCRSRVFGFVTFDSEEVVEDILAHGKMYEIGGKRNMKMKLRVMMIGGILGKSLRSMKRGRIGSMKMMITMIIQNAKIDMFKGTMHLAVDKWGRVEVVAPVNFIVKEDYNLSSVEYELVNVRGLKARVF
eukprot:Gb_03098 [translate_table: standard]